MAYKEFKKGCRSIPDKQTAAWQSLHNAEDPWLCDPGFPRVCLLNFYNIDSHKK